jgi:hypothetical protein
VVFPGGEVARVFEVGRQIEGALAVRGDEAVHELAAKERAEHAHREQVLAAGRDPTGAVRRQATAGDDAVQVGMERELARPAVQHAGDAEQAAQTIGVLAQRQQGAGRRREQEVVDPGGIAPGQRTQRAR